MTLGVAEAMNRYNTNTADAAPEVHQQLIRMPTFVRDDRS